MDFELGSEFSKLTERKLIEEFVDGVYEFAASIFNLTETSQKRTTDVERNQRTNSHCKIT